MAENLAKTEPRLMLSFRPADPPARPHGFTIIELMVVVSIIALLIAILMPALRRARFTAQVAVCSSQMHQWAIALTDYAGDNTGFYPRFDGGSGANNCHDVQWAFVKVFQDRYSVQFPLFYCPLRDPAWSSLKFMNTTGSFAYMGYCYWVPRIGAGGIFYPTSSAGPRSLHERNTNALMTDDLIEFPNSGWPSQDTFSRTWGMPHDFNGVLVNANAAYPDGSVQTRSPSQWEFRYQSGNARTWY